jgi:hypothetical protein
LNAIKQRINQPLHEFEVVFDKYLTKCTTINAIIPDDELVNTYLNSLDYNIFKDQVRALRMQEGTAEYPTNLLAAKILMRKTYNAYVMIL